MCVTPSTPSQGFDPVFGARPVKRALQREVQTLLAQVRAFVRLHVRVCSVACVCVCLRVRVLVRACSEACKAGMCHGTCMQLVCLLAAQRWHAVVGVLWRAPCAPQALLRGEFVEGDSILVEAAADGSCLELHKAPTQQQQPPQQQRQPQEGVVVLQLQQELLPALHTALHVLRAAIRLARHAHESGFAPGFSAGFAAGFAAGLAALGSGVAGGAAAVQAAPHMAFVGGSAGVLQASCIRALPEQMQRVGASLAAHVYARMRGLGRPLCCANPLCVNLCQGSELWLLQHQCDDAGWQDAALCSSCRPCV